MTRARGESWPCVDQVIFLESRWKVTAINSSSGAYGLPQALPAGKMATAGRDWQRSARTQLRWFFGYIKQRYRTACNALAFHKLRGWY